MFGPLLNSPHCSGLIEYNVTGATLFLIPHQLLINLIGVQRYKNATRLQDAGLIRICCFISYCSAYKVKLECMTRKP